MKHDSETHIITNINCVETKQWAQWWSEARAREKKKKKKKKKKTRITIDRTTGSLLKHIVEVAVISHRRAI